jgi:hypothetical protein
VNEVSVRNVNDPVPTGQGDIGTILLPPFRGGHQGPPIIVGWTMMVSTTLAWGMEPTTSSLGAMSPYHQAKTRGAWDIYTNMCNEVALTNRLPLTRANNLGSKSNHTNLLVSSLTSTTSPIIIDVFLFTMVVCIQISVECQ